MSENEEFLARWSRRKHEAKRSRQAEPQGDEPVDVQSGVSVDGLAEPIDPDVDLSNLPPINSIDAATDVTPFLRKGIPPELSRAALRRAWSADPAIRDFVGLAESAWDFNDPTAMRGFGPLDYSQVELGKLVDRIVGGVRQAAVDLADARASEGAGQQSDGESISVRASSSMQTIAIPPGGSATPLIAPQSVPLESGGRGDASVRRRTHGGALPR